MPGGIYTMYHQFQSRPRLCYAGIAMLILIIFKGIYILTNWNTLCYYSNAGDALPAAEDPSFSPKMKSIYFHETSCRGGLTARQACAVEAAARAHPHWQVHVLFSSPVTDYTLKASCLATLLQLHNVKLLRVHLAEYSKGTTLQSILLKDLKESTFPVQHSADILRILTLNKFGGIYLDTDMIVTRSLEQLPSNFVAKESYTDVASGILSFAIDDIGTNVTNAIIEEIRKGYLPEKWAANGAEVVDKVIRGMCPEVVNSATYESKPIHDCKGISIFDFELFYPLYFNQLDEIFNPVTDEFDLDRPYTYHMWDFLSSKRTIHKGTVYEFVAKKFCPTIHETYPDEFAAKVNDQSNIQEQNRKKSG